MAERGAHTDARSPGRVDPWAHRRGEPRVFTLLWAMYLMGVASMTLFAVGVAGPRDPNVLGEGARAMLTLAAFGLGALWPMVRLSQAPPDAPISAAFGDVVAINAPLQALIWPMGLLTDWSPAVLGALALDLLGWSLLVAALLGAAMGGRPGTWSRIGWMTLFLAITLGGPAALARLETLGAPIDPLFWLISPATSVVTLTAHQSGLPVTIAPAEWLGAAAPAAASGPVWLLAALAERRRRRLAPTNS